MSEEQESELDGIMEFIQRFAENYADTSPAGLAASIQRKRTIRMVVGTLVEREPTLMEQFDRVDRELAVDPSRSTPK